MKKILLIFLTITLQQYAQGQVPTQGPYPDAPLAATQINSYSFFIDSVSNVNEQPLAFTAALNNTTAATPINLVGITSGVHQLYAKVTSTNGVPSITNLGNFYMEANNFYINSPASATPIITYSFFIDSVSTVNEQPLAFTAALNNTTAATPINITGVTSGVHQLYAKVTSNIGVPSITNLGNFYMEANNFYANTPAAATPINMYSFFIDSVSNVNEQPLAFTAALNNTTAATPIDLAGVTSGVHQLYAKVTATNGVQSITNLGNFLMTGDFFYPNVTAAPTDINRYEFYIDSVTSTNIQPLSFSSALQNTTGNTNIDLLGVLPGSHQLYVRVFTTSNTPSIVNLGQFLMDQNFRYADAPAPAPSLQNMEYYIDTDPGYGLATAITISGTNTTEVLNNIGISIPNNLASGTHFLHIRSRQNPWSIDNALPFEVGIVLPVTWLYVKAQVLNNNSLVEWSTANELNSKLYEVEWSTDGNSFAKIGSVNAAGNTSSNSIYDFTHSNPASGINYYRIKQIDNDGRFKYSVVVKLIYENANSFSKISIYPNPASNFITVKLPENEKVLLQIFDAQGKQVMTQNVANQASVKLDVTLLAKGNYVLRLSDGKGLYSSSFIKL